MYGVIWWESQVGASVERCGRGNDVEMKSGLQKTIAAVTMWVKAIPMRSLLVAMTVYMVRL